MTWFLSVSTSHRRRHVRARRFLTRASVTRRAYVALFCIRIHRIRGLLVVPDTVASVFSLSRRLGRDGGGGGGGGGGRAGGEWSSSREVVDAFLPSGDGAPFEDRPSRSRRGDARQVSACVRA